jgi:hypothetical protein
MTDRKCADCGADMEVGFLPDLSSSGASQTKWHKGVAEEFRFLGMITGVAIDQKELVPVTAYRCKECGVLRFYATLNNG